MGGALGELEETFGEHSIDSGPYRLALSSPSKLEICEGPFPTDSNKNEVTASWESVNRFAKEKPEGPDRSLVGSIVWPCSTT
jgi:hypothetical protein